MATGIRLMPFLGTATPMTSAALEDTRTRPSSAATFPGRLMCAEVSRSRVTRTGSVMTTLLDAASVGGGAAEPRLPSARDNRTESRRVRRMVIPGYEGMDGPRVVSVWDAGARTCHTYLADHRMLPLYRYFRQGPPRTFGRQLGDTRHRGHGARPPHGLTLLITL